MISKEQVLSGRYRLLSLVGEGGMAFVYKAHDEELDRIVAIKVLRPEYNAGDAFRREARACARLPHPGIVTVYDVGRDDNLQYIVMEYIEGQNLKDLILAEAPFPIGRALDIISQVCKAVGFAHDSGIIHCDLKPQNVLVLPDGQVKVTDFGIARAFTSATPEQRGKIWGTPYYASPELISGQALTPASDVYAIGVMVYEMLTGRLPFDGPSAVDVARQHALNAPPPIQFHNPRVPRYIQQSIDRALAKDPTARYGTAGQLNQILAAYRQRGESVTQPIQPVSVPGSVPTQPTMDVPSPTPAQVAPPVARRAGFDWLLLLLAGAAFVAVMGLFPLWGTVMGRALGWSAGVPTVTPVDGTKSVTPTRIQDTATPSVPAPTVEVRILVPSFVGRELEEARRVAREQGLALAVMEERYDATVPATYIIAQQTTAGELVPKGAQVGVIVSRGPQMVTMPEVVGFPAAVKQMDLQELGLVTVVTETWSIEPVGLIVAQEPPPGTEISAGSVVTLTVSSGPRGEIRADFGGKAMLLSCELNEVSFAPGGSLQVIITWQVLDRFADSYAVFIHVTDTGGRILTQLDRPPLGGSRPTNTWQPGEKLLDPYVLMLPRDAPPGSYWIQVGLYKGNQRLSVRDPGLAKAEGDAVLVRQIQIQ